MNAGPGPGPGRPSGGGGRNRRRRGRRPHSQRGPRPGPAQNRHNADGIYTAPMDHSYRAALAGGNNGHKPGRRPGFGSNYPQAEPEPLPVRDDANSRIFAFVDDWFPVARAGRSETEGPRSGMRHGPAALGVLAKPAAVAAAAWGAGTGRRESGGA